MRYPLAAENNSRDETRSEDSWGVNCFGEKEGEELRGVKRGGLITTVPTVGTLGQGLFNWTGFSITIVNDALYLIQPPSVYVDTGVYPVGSVVKAASGVFYASIAPNNSTTPGPEEPPDEIYPYPVAGQPGVPVGTSMGKIVGGRNFYWKPASSIPLEYGWYVDPTPPANATWGYGSELAARNGMISGSQGGGGYMYYVTNGNVFYCQNGGSWVNGGGWGSIYHVTSRGFNPYPKFIL